MKFHFSTEGELSINNISFHFGDSRILIRQKLFFCDYVEHNEIIDISTSIKEIIIEERKDIYEGCSTENDFFILKYDNQDKLNEIEIYHIGEIQVNNRVFTFDEDLENVAQILLSFDLNVQEGDGEYLFKALKISIMNRLRMGSEGNELGYFYCSNDITHLVEEESLTF